MDFTGNAALTEVLARLAETLAVGPALLLSACESASLCGVGESTFLRRVSAGTMPKQVSFSDGLAQWRRADIERAVSKLKTRDRTARTRNRIRTASLRAAETEGAQCDSSSPS